MKNITHMSCFFKILFKSFFVLLAIMFIVGWTAILLGIRPMPQDVVASFFGGLFWTTTNLLCLYLLIHLFQRYEKGEIFSLKNVTIMRNLGFVLIAKEIIPALFSSVIHLNIFFGLASINLESSVIAGLLILNSWIMDESYHLKKDLQLTI